MTPSSSIAHPDASASFEKSKRIFSDSAREGWDVAINRAAAMIGKFMVPVLRATMDVGCGIQPKTSLFREREPMAMRLAGAPFFYDL
jgi:hypothetical protein